jgi:hypothetical protein
MMNLIRRFFILDRPDVAGGQLKENVKSNAPEFSPLVCYGCNNGAERDGSTRTHGTYTGGGIAVSVRDDHTPCFSIC